MEGLCVYGPFQIQTRWKTLLLIVSLFESAPLRLILRIRSIKRGGCDEYSPTESAFSPPDLARATFQDSRIFPFKLTNEETGQDIK